MKILLTTDVYIKIDGVSTSVRNLYKGLTELGHDVRIITLSNDAKNRKDKAFYYVKSLSLDLIYKDIRMPLIYNRKYEKEIISWKPDIIHSQCEAFTYRYAVRLSEKTGAPIIHTYHTLYDDYVGYVIPFKRFGRWVIQKLTKLRLKKVDVLVVPTHKVEKVMLDYGLKNEIEVIPSGIDLNQHYNRISATKRQEYRRLLGVNDNELLLINLGRIATEKNLESLILYYKKAVETIKNLRLIIVGDGPERENLISLCKKLDLENKVIFTGMVDRDKVHNYYQLGDVFVSASNSETQGLTYVEAMANSLPLLCKYDVCLEGVVKQGENGYFFEDEESFIKNLNILTDENLRIKMGDESLKLSTNYDKKQFGSALEKVYVKALKNSNAK